jgi:hypothetical protein
LNITCLIGKGYVVFSVYMLEALHDSNACLFDIVDVIVFLSNMKTSRTLMNS